ncbi:MAG: pyridoxal 5'-phosphate synthase glutaminase subunit PdxT [Chloracidobacterium sp.]|uniref:Pyridoxal 5'-phosphate synthase subunit PdxT n=1 Tax=Chloracidobacterium validum TaxID=2821543 RepID=A0ABX8B7Y9_9BACT|nr:pyridoxal 5'-phosphate synthase glutaminase subunit PdxT [Chloracidobacterium validum]QUW02776.1 pyridoxal 5'-phosphate synthase glutaminase subunit PdxT [Chloracidobacterium validum]
MTNGRRRVGILSFQGDFAAHARALRRAGAEPSFVRRIDDLAHLDGLILPGGESTTMLRFLQAEPWFDALREFAASERPLFGTCAGAILLAQSVIHPAQTSLGLLDMTIRRNGYGRQLDSFTDTACITALGEAPLELVFIRAPIIESVGTEVEVLAECGGYPVWVRQGRVFAATFHPEMTDDARVHQFVFGSGFGRDVNRSA